MRCDLPLARSFIYDDVRIFIRHFPMTAPIGRHRLRLKPRHVVHVHLHGVGFADLLWRLRLFFCFFIAIITAATQEYECPDQRQVKQLMKNIFVFVLHVKVLVARAGCHLRIIINFL